MFPLKTERSSSGLIEFSNVAEAVLAIMKCNHIPIENKGMSKYKNIGIFFIFTWYRGYIHLYVYCGGCGNNEITNEIALTKCTIGLYRNILDG